MIARRPVTIWLPDGPQTVGRAPEVDREWLADGPGQPALPAMVAQGPTGNPTAGRSGHASSLASSAAAVVLVVVAAFAACLRLGLAPPVAGAAAFLAGAAAALAAGRRPGGGPVGLLTRAQNGLIHGEDARRVLGRLGGVEAAGRAGRCLGITRRCLEQAGRHGHLQEVLRWEAVRWLGRTLDTLSQDVKQ